MDLNTFTIDQLPFQTCDTLPEFCVRRKVDLGKVPDEKDSTNPVYYMDKIFAAGGEQPVPPTPDIPSNEIWYTTVDGKIWDWQGIVDTFAPQGATNLSPELLSNEWDETDHVYKMVFDGNIDAVGIDDTETMTVHVFFVTNPEFGVECNVETIILPNSTTEIKSYCFGGNANLVSVDLGNSVTSIGDYAFNGCSGLTSATIPNSVTSIGDYAFNGCSGLTSATIGNSVTSIGDMAFSECSGLTSVTIGNSVTSIGYQAFYGCTSLTSIEIPDSITSIGYEAFAECTGLASVTIGNSVTSIGNQAFYGCSGLTSVTCEALTPPTLDGSSVFNNTNDCPIYVPSQSVDAYKEAQYWSYYADRIQAIQ